MNKLKSEILRRFHIYTIYNKISTKSETFAQQKKVSRQRGFTIRARNNKTQYKSPKQKLQNHVAFVLYLQSINQSLRARIANPRYPVEYPTSLN